MNIQSRLKKMENRIIGSDSEFCDCQKEPQITVVIPTADGKGKTIDGEQSEEPLEFCETCGKPNPEPFHFTFVIKPPEENQK